MVSVSASVNLHLHHKVQKFSSGTSSPGWSRKKGRKTVVCVCVFHHCQYSYSLLPLQLSSLNAELRKWTMLSTQLEWIQATETKYTFVHTKCRKVARKTDQWVARKLTSNHYYHYFHLTVVFFTWTQVNRFPFTSSSTSFGREPLENGGMEFFIGWMSFLSPNHQRQALKGTQSMNSNQWPGLILDSSTTALLTAGMLFPLCRLPDASENQHVSRHKKWPANHKKTDQRVIRKLTWDKWTSVYRVLPSKHLLLLAARIQHHSALSECWSCWHTGIQLLTNNQLTAMSHAHDTTD